MSATMLRASSLLRPRSLTRPLGAAAGSGKLWGGRFQKDTEDVAVPWAESLTCDQEMVREDIWGSLAHVSMLGHQGVIPATQASGILGELVRLQDDFQEGRASLWDEEFIGHDDVHMNIEARLIAKTSMDVGGRMHTTRSRNDQVPTSSKLRTRNLLLDLRGNLVRAVDAFLERASADGMDHAVMPGYTHVQHAQPISVAFWLSHYAAALCRDLHRLKNAYNVVDQNPLGGGAISGTSFPIDRQLTSRLLGFQTTQLHSLDATGNRDFMLEVLNANATLHSTWSRFAEELILWSSHEFRTVTIDDGFAMGSSMMPQKKNPGTLELLRGRAGIMNGYAAAGLSFMKGLPSGYNRDFHEEKELLFASTNMAIRASSIVPRLVETTQFNLERMEDLCHRNFMTATELANYLVEHHDIPFRATHHVVGSLVGEMVKSGDDLRNLDMVMAHLEAEGVKGAKRDMVEKVLDPQTVMLSYNSEGGTGPEAVKQILHSLRCDLQHQKELLQADQSRVDTALEAARSLAYAAQKTPCNNTQDFQKLVQAHVANLAKPTSHPTPSEGWQPMAADA